MIIISILSVKIVIQLRDGKIVSGSDDKTIKIWDTDDDYKLFYCCNI
jgi:WD40 repeat protein